MTIKSNAYALLIGVDHYMPNPLFGHLGGCVQDVTHVEKFLKKKLGLPEKNMLKLLAKAADGDHPAGPAEHWPTYENMVAAFKKITDMAAKGDQVYIHYAGHGGRAATIYPDLKGENAEDETLVPTNLGHEGRYLRDIELAYILDKMVRKGLIVTIVLDSCHSGGATRGKTGAKIRGAKTSDKSPRPKDSLVATPAELGATWRDLSQGKTRNVKPGSGWLPEAKGYVLLAACLQHELANEDSFNGKEVNGALTYWLLETLKQIRPGLTYKMLHHRLLAKIHSHFQDQTPQLQGDGNRTVFGSDHIEPHYAVNVMEVAEQQQEVKLATGEMFGIAEKAEFAVYALNATDFSEIDQRVAMVEISNLGATESWARVTKTFGKKPIAPGAQAVLTDPGELAIRRKVALVQRENLTQPRQQDSALQKLREALQQKGRGFVEQAQEKEAVTYQVAINDADEYEIWDAQGKPLANLQPALKISDDRAAERVTERLVHLSKYHAIQQLENFDSLSPLQNKLEVELFKAPAGYRRGQRPPANLEKFDDPGNTPTIPSGAVALMRIKNNSTQVLNVAALDLQPDWGITQFFPSERHGDFVPIDPGKEIWEPLEVSLPEGYAEGRDTLKFFASAGPTNFRWLELPALDQGTRSPRTRGLSPNSALEQLFAEANADTGKTRTVKTMSYPSEEWTVTAVELRVERG